MTDVTRRPYPLNVEGDFYVEDGCCITCGVMHDVAPTLFSWGDSHCYVSKQPSTLAELEQMIEATDVTEIDCVRYRGEDPNLLRRLVERGQADLLDTVSPLNARPYARDRTLFEVKSAILSAEALAVGFAAWARDR